MALKTTLLCGTQDGLIRLPGQRGLKVHKTLDGGFAFEVEGAGDAVKISKAAAFDMACAILRDCGANVNFDYAQAKERGLVK